MTITKNRMPEGAVLSHNLVPVEISTDKYLLSAGTKQVIRLVFVDNTSNNKTITIGWKEFDMVLTFKTTPDDSGMQLPLYNKTLITGYDTLIVALKANYYLQRYYIITSTVTLVSGHYECTVNMTQRQFGQAFAAINIAGNDGTKYTPSIPTAQIMPVYSTNFRALLDLYWQVNGAGAQNYNNLISQLDASSVDDTGICQFNLNDVFKKWRELRPDFPLMADVEIERCDNVMKNYWVRIAESYGTPELINSNVMEPSAPAANNYLKVILGGMPFLTWPGNTFYADYINSGTNKFLTTQISGKTTVTQVMKNWLYFYMKTNPTSFHIKGMLYLSDGTSVAIPATTAQTPTQKTINRAAVGYTQLGLNSLLSGLEPVSYDVWIEDNTNTRITEIFNFKIDLRYNEYENYLFFHNSLGGVDTVLITGNVSPIPEQRADEIQKAIANDYTNGNIETINSQTRLAWDVNTGYRQNKNEIDHLIELGQSNEVRWLPDSKMKAGVTEPIRVVIEKDSVKNWPADTDNMYCLQFKMREAHYEF